MPMFFNLIFLKKERTGVRKEIRGKKWRKTMKHHPKGPEKYREGICTFHCYVMKSELFHLDS